MIVGPPPFGDRRQPRHQGCLQVAHAVVMGRAVGLNPLTVIFSIFVGAKSAGIIGAIIAIPLAVLIKIVILYFYATDGQLPDQDRLCRPARPRRTKT